MKHIRQKNGIDCGVAVVAMFCGESYQMAKIADPFPERDWGLSVQDFRDTVFNLTEQAIRVSRGHYAKPLSGLRLRPAAILIRESGKTFGHWVWSDGQLIYDPERPHPQPLSTYDRATWLVIRQVFSEA